MSDFWKILRILTTNQCNYKCLYCHNEGQEKARQAKMLMFDEFVKIVDVIDGMGFQEIRFSGGEPLINPYTVNMIEWLNENSDYEIGLSTNASLITEEIAQKLGKTRVLLTIHLPAITDINYQYVTGRHNQTFLDAIKMLDRYEVKYSFNFVLYPETIINLNEVIGYAVNNGKRIKLLPFIESGFNNLSIEIIRNVSEKLDTVCKFKNRFEEKGFTVWEFENGGVIKLIDSPCYTYDINKCRAYGELRLLPDLSLQRCIFDTNVIALQKLSPHQQREKILDLWKSFDKCLCGE